MSGDIQIQPGPTRNPPCGLCETNVKMNQIALCCNKWRHCKCLEMSLCEYRSLGKSNQESFCGGTYCQTSPAYFFNGVQHIVWEH